MASELKKTLIRKKEACLVTEKCTL